MSRYKWLLIALVSVALVLSACSLVPPPHPGSVPERILFIGNSLTYTQDGLDQHLYHMAASAHPPLKLDVEASTIPDATLKQLYEDGKAVEAIRTGNWDVVVLQEHSLPSVLQSDMFPEYVRKFDDEIGQAGARTVLYMPRGRLTMSAEEVSHVYSAAARDVGASVAPVAIAWQRVNDADPSIELYEDYVHPNMLGMYLTAAVLYATIFDRSPVGLSFRPLDMLPDPDSVDPAFKKMTQDLRDQYHDKYYISDENADLLQRIAWETVQEYQAQERVTE